jgi:uncharacterized protein (DUF2164 family)
MDNKAAKIKWGKSDISYKNYQAFIKNKNDRFSLSLIDLLYISNFKGGNATINEEEGVINRKLTSYSDKLREIEKTFISKNLFDLTEMQIDKLIQIVESICNLTKKEVETKIDGFSASYLSALLSAYFPNLIPILDRRVLINLKLVQNNDINKAGQIKDIQMFYAPLIKKIAKISKQEPHKMLREIDEDIFIKNLI